MDTLPAPPAEKFRYFSPSDFPVSPVRYTLWFAMGMLAALPEASSRLFRLAEPLVDKVGAASDYGFGDGYDLVADTICTFNRWRRRR